MTPTGFVCSSQSASAVDLGQKVHLPDVLNMDVEKVKKVQTKLVLDAKQEAKERTVPK